MSYRKDCESFESKEEAEEKCPELPGRDTCCHIKGKGDFIDNNNMCPPDCDFYFQRS